MSSLTCTTRRMRRPWELFASVLSVASWLEATGCTPREKLRLEEENSGCLYSVCNFSEVTGVTLQINLDQGFYLTIARKEGCSGLRHCTETQRHCILCNANVFSASIGFREWWTKKTLYRDVCGFTFILLWCITSKEVIFIWQMDI